MTRTQREVHRRIFSVLPWLLLAVLACALIQRRAAHEHLLLHSEPPRIQGGTP